MTGTPPTFEQRQQSKAYVTQTVVALATAGTALCMAREGTPKAGQELIDALREDIARMIGDVGALQQVIHEG